MYLTWLVLVNVFLFFSFRHLYKDLNVELNFKVQCEKRNWKYRNIFTPSAWIWFLVSIKHIKTWKIKSIWRMDGLVFASSETNKTGVTVESTPSPHDREKPNTFRPQVETRKLLGKFYMTCFVFIFWQERTRTGNGRENVGKNACFCANASFCDLYCDQPFWDPQPLLTFLK